MRQFPPNRAHTPGATSQLATTVLSIPPTRRGAVLPSVVSLRPSPTIHASLAVGRASCVRELIDARDADFREEVAAPIDGLLKVLDPPIPMKVVLEFRKLMFVRGATDATCHASKKSRLDRPSRWPKVAH